MTAVSFALPRCLRTLTPLFVLFWMILVSQQAHAFKVDWSFEGGLRFNYTKNGFSYDTIPPSLGEDDIGGSLLLNTELAITFNDFVEFNLSFDIGEFSVSKTTSGGTSALYVLLGSGHLNASAEDLSYEAEELKSCQTQANAQGLDTSICNTSPWYLVESLFLRELYLTFYTDKEQWMSLTVGSMSHKIGHGLVYDSYAIGAYFKADFTERKAAIPLRIEAGIFLPDSSFTSIGKKSPMVHLEITFAPNDDNEIGLFFVYLRDGDNLAGELLLPLWQEFYEDAFNKKVAELSRTGNSPNMSCFQEMDVDAIKATLPPKQKLEQARCEAANEKLDEDNQKQCPADKLYEEFYNRTCTLIPESTGNHFWLGIQGEAKFGRFSFEGAAVLYFSQMVISTPRLTKPRGPSRRRPPKQQYRPPPRPGTRPQPLVIQQTDVSSITPTSIAPKALNGLGFSLELVATYAITPDLDAKAFFLFATGDTINNKTDTIRAFSGISPRILHTNVFFSGGINAFSSMRNISISGYGGKGYMVPGFSLEYEKEKKAEATVTVAAAFAHEKRRLNSGKQSGLLYGYEFNVSGGYFVLPWCKPVLEFDVFVPGNFLEPTNAVLFQFLVGVDFVF